MIAGAFVVVADAAFALTERDPLIVGFDTFAFVFVLHVNVFLLTLFSALRRALRVPRRRSYL